MLRNKAVNQALELGTIYVSGWYLGLGGSNTSDLPIQSHSQREELLVTSLLVLFLQLSESWWKWSSCQEFHLLSHQLLFLIDMIRWRSVQFSYSVVSDSVTPWIAARQASLPITNSWNSLKLMSIESVMSSSHLILCRPLFLLPPNPSQHQSLFQWINSSHEVAKVLEFQLQHQSFQWKPRTDFL